MLKYLLGGIAACAAVMATAHSAQAQIPVLYMCPEAYWTEGYHIWELIPLDPEQYKLASVIEGPSDVRSGVGFDAEVIASLESGAEVTIIGEAWDMGCNHWLRVLINGEPYWMAGRDLQLL